MGKLSVHPGHRAPHTPGTHAAARVEPRRTAERAKQGRRAARGPKAARTSCSCMPVTALSVCVACRRRCCSLLVALHRRCRRRRALGRISNSIATHPPLLLASHLIALLVAVWMGILDDARVDYRDLHLHRRHRWTVASSAAACRMLLLLRCRIARLRSAPHLPRSVQYQAGQGCDRPRWPLCRPQGDRRQDVRRRHQGAQVRTCAHRRHRQGASREPETDDEPTARGERATPQRRHWCGRGARSNLVQQPEGTARRFEMDAAAGDFEPAPGRRRFTSRLPPALHPTGAASSPVALALG